MLRRLSKTLAASLLLVALSLAQQPSPTPAPQQDDPNKTARPLALSGRLVMRGGKAAVRINGNKTNKNTTILQRDVIETMSCTRTVVQFGTAPQPLLLGSLVMAPETEAQVLEFTDGSVEVELRKGCVVLRPNKDVVGTVRTPAGKVEQTDASRANSFIDICYPDSAMRQAATTYCCPAGAGWFVTQAPLLASAAAAATGAGIVATDDRPPDPSQSVPGITF